MLSSIRLAENRATAQPYPRPWNGQSGLSLAFPCSQGQKCVDQTTPTKPRFSGPRTSRPARVQTPRTAAHALNVRPRQQVRATPRAKHTPRTRNGDALSRKAREFVHSPPRHRSTAPRLEANASSLSGEAELMRPLTRNQFGRQSVPQPVFFAILSKPPFCNGRSIGLMQKAKPSKKKEQP